MEWKVEYVFNYFILKKISEFHNRYNKIQIKTSSSKNSSCVLWILLNKNTKDLLKIFPN